MQFSISKSITLALLVSNSALSALKSVCTPDFYASASIIALFYIRGNKNVRSLHQRAIAITYLFDLKFLVLLEFSLVLLDFHVDLGLDLAKFFLFVLQCLLDSCVDFLLSLQELLHILLHFEVSNQSV